MTIKICPDCGEERQIAESELKRKGATRCRRCSIKRDTFNLKGPKRWE